MTVESQVVDSGAVDSGAATAVLQNNAAIMSVVGYFIPVCLYHFGIAVWRAKRQNPAP
jgi:hypothetical protein